MNDLKDTLQKRSKMTEVCEIVKRFKGFRKTKNGQQEVTVEILHGGSEAGALRYYIYAQGQDGRFATGNPAGTIEEALAIVHWDELD